NGAPRALALNDAAFGTSRRWLWRTFKACTDAVDNFRHGPNSRAIQSGDSNRPSKRGVCPSGRTLTTQF
ncbi:hypothetical protein, partial [Comamonas sp. SCN 67-35]|uniref:hypothetical protein n=1 Tax=Comamonas sp. SCN 67-35 TaxID=1660096 RepID=UPI0025C70B84